MALLPVSGWKEAPLTIPNLSSIVNPRLYYAPSGDLFISSTTGIIYVVWHSNPTRLDLFAGSGHTDNNSSSQFTNGHRISEATFRCPRGMACDDAGLLVADSGCHVIRLISGERVITFAGTTKGFADGSTSDCKFTNPICIVKNGQTIFIAEENKIRMICNDGKVTSMQTARKSKFAMNPMFKDQSFLMVSPDGRKVYELDISNYNDVYSLVYTRVDSVHQHRIDFPKVNTIVTPDVPSITSTPEGYIVFINGNYVMYDWNTDLPIGEKKLLPSNANGNTIKRTYHAVVSPSCGTLASIRITESINSRDAKTGDVYLKLITFTRLFAESWKTMVPSTHVDFSSMFDCHVAYSSPNTYIPGDLESDSLLPNSDGVDEEESVYKASILDLSTNVSTTASVTTLKLHISILQPYFPDFVTLQKSLEQLRNMKHVNVACRRLFLASLYKPDLVETLHSNNPEDCGFDILSQLIMVIRLYALFNIDTKSLKCILWKMLYDNMTEGAVMKEQSEEVTILNKDANVNQELLIKLFFFIWKNCKRSYELLDIVVWFMTIYPDIFFDKWSSFSELMTADAIEMSQCMEFFFHMTGSKGKRNLSRIPDATLITSHASRDRIEPSTAIYKHLQNLYEHECSSVVTSDTIIPDGMFRIGIIGCEKFLHAHEWVLYARWHFFRRMLAVGGGEEVSSRHILLPTEFPFELLECIIQILYYQHPLPLDLSYDTCLFFIDQGAQFDLTDFEHNKVDPFEKLHLYCSLQVFEPLSVANCIKMTVLHSQVGNEEQLEVALAFTALNFPAAISASPQELKNLSADLLHRISQLHATSVCK